jgi:hypothetical protein
MAKRICPSLSVLLALVLLLSNAYSFQICKSWKFAVKTTNQLHFSLWQEKLHRRHDEKVVSFPTIRLHQTSTSGDKEANSPSFFTSPASIIFGKAWLLLALWAFSPYAPGSLGSAQDTEMLNAIIADPVNPGINELYYTAFNFFATIPVVMACLILPQGRKEGVPAFPFLALSSAIGYFAIGPYLALRASPVSNIEEKRGSVSWATTNIFENKALNWFIFMFTLYLPVAANVLGALVIDPDALLQGFVDLVTTSRFASVSLADIALQYAALVYLTPRDYHLRKPEASVEEARAVAAATAMFPVLGSALYCALRPKLPETSL